MTRSLIRRGWAGALAVAAALTGAAAAQERGAPRHLEAARSFVRDLAPADTEYRHKDAVVRWKGVDGDAKNEARTDCSGFVDALFAHAYGLSRDDFKKWTGKARPLASTYHDVIAAGKGFTRVETVAAVLPGDLIAIRYPAGADDTGHVLLVDAAPRKRAATAPLQANTEQWEVRVIDSSKSGHGPTDTRRLPGGTFSTGVGEGVFRLYSGADGAVAGHSWSTGAKSEYRDQSSRPLVIGRYDPKSRP